eukprot:2629744-Amphidinium_carterae.1
MQSRTNCDAILAQNGKGLTADRLLQRSCSGDKVVLHAGTRRTTWWTPRGGDATHKVRTLRHQAGRR